MSENESAQQPIIKPGHTIIFITVVLWGIICASVFLWFYHLKRTTDIPFLCNITLTLLLILNYRTEEGFYRIYIGYPKSSALLIFFKSLYFITALPLLGAFKNGNIHIFNRYVILVTLVVSLAFTLSAAYKNEYFYRYKIRLVENVKSILFLGLIAGYSFAMLLNCSAFAGKSEIYATTVQAKYIKIVHNNGISKVPHFIINDWDYLDVLGNDVEGIHLEGSGACARLKDIQTGDTIYIKVHEGILQLPWMEPQGFKSLKR